MVYDICEDRNDSSYRVISFGRNTKEQKFSKQITKQPNESSNCMMFMLCMDAWMENEINIKIRRKHLQKKYQRSNAANKHGCISILLVYFQVSYKPGMWQWFRLSDCLSINLFGASSKHRIAKLFK